MPRSPRRQFRPAFEGQACSLGYKLCDDVERDLGIELTNEQAIRLIRLYQVDVVTGRRLVRRAALRRPKGAGKSPEAGYVSFLELVGDVIFDCWDDDGQPVGMPRAEPWVQLAALSEDQTDNVSVWLFDTLADQPDTIHDYGIDLGRSRIYLSGRPGRLEPVTSAAGSREGQRVTFGALDQTESWTRTTGGIRLAGVIRRNAAKMSGWTYELQNAPEPDDGSVADLTEKAAAKNPSILFDTVATPPVDLEALRSPASTPTEREAARDQLRSALEVGYGEARIRLTPDGVRGWVDTERIVEECEDPDTEVDDILRYYLNNAVVRQERAFDRLQWTAVDTPMPADGAFITVGFYGTRLRGAALVCCEVDTGVMWLHDWWEAPENRRDWEVPTDEVTAAVEDVFDAWEPWRLYGDPSHFGETMAGWAGRFDADRAPRERRIVEWWTNSERKMGYATREFAAAVRSGSARRVPDDTFDRHVRSAVRRFVAAYDDTDRVRQLWVPGEATPTEHATAARAAVMAWAARLDAVASHAAPSARTPATIRSW